MQQLGRYEILAELGRGAMGTVYRARDPRIDRVVAVKTITVLGVNAEQEQQYRERFFREAQAAGKLSHPGIVTIHDVDEDAATRTPFIVMEYIAGRTLDNLVAESAPSVPPLEKALDLVKQIAEALDYAHAQNIVHRDIKPANILVTAEGRAKIADFGVAKLTHQDFTVPGQILGTASYMAPEQLQGKAVDGRADLFGLGVILYWMLTGEKPFTGSDTSAILYKVAFEDAPPVTARNPALLPEVDAVVRRALAKDPAQRYQRGQELAHDLQDLIDGRVPRSQVTAGTVEKTVIAPIAAAAPPVGAGGPPARPSLPKRGNRKVIVAATAAAVLLLAFLPLLLRRAGGPAASSSVSDAVAARPTTTLNLRSVHNFRMAALSIWVDDKLIHEDKLVGAVRKKWFKTTVIGSYAETIKVPAGEAKLRVRIYSPSAGYDEAQEIATAFPADRESMLSITFGGKTRRLQLIVQD